MRRKNNKRRQLPKPIMPLSLEIMTFLWKWKLSTALVLYHGVGRREEPRSFNTRLRKLEEAGYLELNFDYACRGRKLWELTDLGMACIRSTLPDLKDAGIKSPNLEHDFLSLALILGEWPFQLVPTPEIVTDQQLLRMASDCRPKWIPETTNHRPDGYLRIPPTQTGAEALAFEVEISTKNFWRYRERILDYQTQRKTHRVIWMYRDPYFITQFLKAKDDLRDPSTNYHLFMAEAEYMKDGWSSRVSNQCTETHWSFRELVRGKGVVDRGEAEGIGGDNSKISIFTDRKKFIDVKKT